jgi:TonB-linked SusC/RagA family outer membrane protein
MRKFMVMAMAMLLFAGQLLAQNRTISGKVTDSKGNPVANASVIIRGTSKGTTTKEDGTFTISILPNAKILQISSQGFDRKDIAIGSVDNIGAVELLEKQNDLEEVVVVGFERKKRREVAGPVSSVKAKDIEQLPVQSFDRAIQGKMAGVQVTGVNGIPGGAIQVRIRGVGSINAGTSPLYIIDGVQVSSGDQSRNFPSSNALSSINPDDIESIEVLKDPATAAVYGAQAANGVVIVTTKRGKAGRSKINFSTYQGVSEVINKTPVLTTGELVQLAYESRLNRYGKADADAYVQSTFGTTKYDTLPTYDWQDLVFRKGYIQNYELGVNGGNEKTTFYLSGSYNKFKGHVVFSDFERGTMKLNLDHKLSDKVSFATSINLSSYKQNGVSGGGAFVNPMRSGILMWPSNAPYNADGTYNSNFFGSYYINPLQTADFNIYNARTIKALGNAALTYKILPELSFRSSFNIEFTDIKENAFQDPRTPDGSAVNGRVNKFSTEYIDWQTDQTLNYSKVFGGIHSVSGLVGIQYRSNVFNGFNAQGTGVPTYQFTTLAATAVPVSLGAGFSNWKLFGGFAKASYTYDEKYIFTGTIRRDGSSRFGSNNRYGWFPGAAVAWRINKENFMKTADFVDELKLRFSYGVTGNSALSNYGNRGLLGLSGEYVGLPGAAPSQLASPDLSWEENVSANIGLDYSFLNSRISGAIEVFQNDRKRLLLNKPLPVTSGFSSINENVGTLRNRGIEFELSTRNLVGAFTWTTNFNISYVKNKVTSLLNGQDRISTAVLVGKPLNSIFTYKYAGVNPADGRPMYYDTLGNITYVPIARDRYYLDRTFDPNFYGGITNTFGYHNFELRVFFQFSGGNYVLNQDRIFASRAGSTVDRNQYRDQLRRWQKPGDITDVPKAFFGGTITNAGSNSFLSDRFYERADYIRLKEVILAYNFTKRIMQKLNIQGGRLYFSAVNLWTKSSYSGYDPEFVDNASGDFGVYPQGKQMTVGIQVTL